MVAGLGCLAALAELGICPHRDITVMAIRAEESVWFEQSYIGSRSALGMLPSQALEAKRIDTRRSLATHIAECGGNPDIIRLGRPLMEISNIHTFVELHIEQAPSLVEANKAVGIGTSIPGNFRYPNATILGRYDHVGTPRRFRSDAAMAASEFAIALDRLWEVREKEDIPMAITLGRFHTNPLLHGMTSVPGEFSFSLDVRAHDKNVLSEIERDVLAISCEISKIRDVKFVFGERAQANIGVMCPKIIVDLERVAEELDIPIIRLASPASHDAAAFAAAGVPVGMIFIRNTNGSHNPKEHMDVSDLLDGASVLTRWLLACSKCD